MKNGLLQELYKKLMDTIEYTIKENSLTLNDGLTIITPGGYKGIWTRDFG